MLKASRLCQCFSIVAVGFFIFIGILILNDYEFLPVRVVSKMQTLLTCFYSACIYALFAGLITVYNSVKVRRVRRRGASELELSHLKVQRIPLTKNQIY
mmetsp:Transcript_32129/g.55486  ORF Transcript_32129/g.55486 Transcript_32129/m.55486 type:complete len:99 (+) Transcript_32129:304-600(+)